MPDILRIGLIGCGNQTRANLAPGLARIPSARLVACADMDAGRARQVADECRIEKVYSSAGELIQDKEVDAVIVAVPHRHLKSVALSVLDAGKHLFIEKPMGLNATEGAEVVEAAQRRGVVAMVGYCMRYSLSRMFVKSLLDRGVVGDIAFIAAGKGSAPLGGWLAAPYAEGGGELLFLGSHLTDQVLWMTGVVRLRRGAVATFSVSQAVHTSYDYVDIFGTKGHVRGDWYGDLVTVQSQVIPEYAHPTVIRVPGDSLREMCGREMAAFVGAALSAGPSPIPAVDGLRVLRILDAVVASDRSGNWVKM